MDTASSLPSTSTNNGVVAEAPDAGDPAVAGVAGVIASLDRLPDLPVAEHLPVFEAAHKRLRAALADAGPAPASARQPS